MTDALRAVKGTRDLLPPETAVWSYVEDTARRVFSLYGYEEIRTPVLEPTELFVRGVGESTDIVGKEMYTFEDRKGRSLTLRPESTAAIVRSFVQHGMVGLPLPLRLYCIGPQFRYERPQKGRYRQFHQIDAEILGDPGPHADGELVVMLVRFLEELGLSELEVLLNTVGDEESRAVYREALVEFLTPHRESLGEDSRRRLETNPLRILDTKSAAERELLAEAPRLEDHLNAASREHFAGVRGVLDEANIPYRVESRLVRGLDYYTRTVFEIVSAGLGAQDAIVGGGRYDGLVEELGGSPLPAIGFAIGQDRLIDVLPEATRELARPAAPAAVIPAKGATVEQAMALAEELRAAGVAAIAELSGRSVKAALKTADRRGARYALLLGEEELAAGEVTIKDLESGEQERVSPGELPQRLGESG